MKEVFYVVFEMKIFSGSFDEVKLEGLDFNSYDFEWDLLKNIYVILIFYLSLFLYVCLML